MNEGALVKISPSARLRVDSFHVDSTTPFMVFSVTYYLELHNAIIFFAKNVRFLPIKVIYGVYRPYNLFNLCW